MATPQPSVSLCCQPCGNGLLKRRIIHEPNEDVLILVHAFDEERLQQILEHQLELVLWIHGGGLSHAVIEHSRLDDLVEEQLVRLIEVRAEALVDQIDQS